MSGIELIPLEGDVPSPEVIISLEPDLVIVPEEFATPLEGIVPTFIPLPLNSLEALFENMPFYGQLLDREAEAEIAIKALQDRISAYQNTVPRNDLTVMNIISVDESDPSGGELFVRTLNSADCALLDLILECPYEDPVANGQAYSFSTNIEYVLEQDPDVLLVRFREIPLNEGRELLESDILWSELSAVQNDRLITGNVNLTASGFAEATFLLDNTIPRIFPDVFPNGPLTDEEVQEILAEQ
ncbi:MAG: ABC transporter substrate-binding protein [Chloroflexota bacterium]